MRCAYVTFLMRNDSYLPGALTLAYALKLYTKNDCVCLVTEEISKSAKAALETLYDHVIPIDGVILKSLITGGRQDRSHLLTRFLALRLGSDGRLCKGYDKILLLDSDVLPLACFDTLFELPAPAGIIMENKADCYTGGGDGSEWSWHKRYGSICPHGSLIPRYLTDRVRDDTGNMGVNAGLWLLEPDTGEYERLHETLRDNETLKLVTERFPWPEMQLGTLFWSGRWTNIDIRYCSIGGYPSLDVLMGVHYAGLKPWRLASRSIEHYTAKPDFAEWYRYFASMFWSIPALREYPMLKRLWDFCRTRVGIF